MLVLLYIALIGILAYRVDSYLSWKRIQKQGKAYNTIQRVRN
jgi:hypothetical protein